MWLVQVTHVHRDFVEVEQKLLQRLKQAEDRLSALEAQLPSAAPVAAVEPAVPADSAAAAPAAAQDAGTPPAGDAPAAAQQA